MLPTLAIFLLFALVGAFLLLDCPPLWRDYDGLIQISNRPNDMTILQYPPAYPFFSRMHVYAAEIISGWVHHVKTAIHIRKAVTLNDAGIHALVVSQQLALALALTYFTLLGAPGWKGRLLIALLLISNAAIFIPAQLISTEALSQSLLVLFVALGLRLFRAERLSAWACGGYALVLIALILTRHANAVFAMLLPLAYFFASFAGGRARAWKLAALYIGLGVVCILASDLATRALCHVFDVEYRNISARGTSEKLGFVDHMTPPERGAFLARLQAQASDPIVKEAIPLLARHAAWTEQREEIETLLRRTSPDLPEEKLHVAADAYLERVAGLFYATHNHYLLMEMNQATWRTLAQATAGDVSRYFLRTAAWSIDLYPTQASLDKRTHDLAVCSPAAKDRIVAFEQNPWLRLWDWAPNGAFLLLSALVSIALLFRGIGDAAAQRYAIAIGIVSVVSTVMTFYFVNYQPRFTSVVASFAFLSLGLVIGSVSGPRPQPASTP
jgi:hypothetical protein